MHTVCKYELLQLRTAALDRVKMKAARGRIARASRACGTGTPLERIQLSTLHVVKVVVARCMVGQAQ
jgi:hypothetical protein